MTINNQTVHALKASGHYFAAGALAASLGMDNNYGCHFGMRSDRDNAIEQYKAGHTALQRS